MYQAKRFLSLLLIMVVMVTTLAIPAFAAEVMGNAFAAFPAQTSSSYSRSYTRAIQAYLLGVSDTTFALIRNNGGMDGVYGSATVEGVGWTQENFFKVTRTGECDSSTWRLMGDSLLDYGTVTDSETGHSYHGYGLWDGTIYRTRAVNNKTEFSVYNILGGGWAVFRTA